MRSENCLAKYTIAGDYQCTRCDIRWDLGDTDKPDCLTPREIALSMIEKVLSDDVSRDPKLHCISYHNGNVVVSFNNTYFEGVNITVGSDPSIVSNKLRDLADLIENNC